MVLQEVPDVTVYDFDQLHHAPVFVGEVDATYIPVVHYVAPHWDDTAAMLAGLLSFADRTTGKSSLARAAVISFGFVYIHPMVDGNGRISRFLINDVLRRDGALPAPYIVPISAVNNLRVGPETLVEFAV